MRDKIFVSIAALFVLLALPPVMWAQGGAPPPPGWKACPRCQTQNDRREMREKYNVDGHAFNPRDLSGIWGYNGYPLDQKTFPGFTPAGEKLWNATKGEFGLNNKDPMIHCDPLGYPRWFTYNYGTQFVTEPDRVMQFFEWGHTWRDIWTDGRKLPDNPPELRWLGWNIGHWEGNTFVIESNGFDERSWIDQDRRVAEGARGRGVGAGGRGANGEVVRSGIPHSDQMRVEERLTRTSYGTLDETLTIIDPAVLKAPWVSKATMILGAGTEIWEYFCVPSQEEEFNNKIMLPAAGGAAPPKK